MALRIGFCGRRNKNVKIKNHHGYRTFCNISMRYTRQKTRRLKILFESFRVIPITYGRSVIERIIV